MAIKLHNIKEMGVLFYSARNIECEAQKIKIRISFTSQEQDG